MDKIKTGILSVVKRIASLPLLLKLVLIIAFISGGYIWKTKINAQSTGTPTYQTEKVEKGTIVSSVTASGKVATSNSTSVTTQASGVISKIYVKDGDIVKAGDQVAEIDLDLEGKQRASQSYASYLSAKNTLQSAKDKYYTLQSSLMTNWKKYMDTAQNSTYENDDGTPNTDNRNLAEFYTIKDNWLQTEADYKLQESVINQAQTNLNNAWLSYQQSSSSVYAPITGSITGLSLQVGSFITAQSNTSGTSTSQRIANIVTSAPPTITVDVTEADTPKIAIDDKATVTFDALPGKTFTGSVVSIDTVGEVTSGVTSYPTTIKLDIPDPAIFSNMGAQATIIIDSKSDVLMVPNAAVKTVNGGTYVQMMNKNNQLEQVAVETGIVSDEKTEIISGLAEGDTVVTGSTSSTKKTSTTSTSIFGGGLRMGR